jgi:hypothetical protein
MLREVSTVDVSEAEKAALYCERGVNEEIVSYLKLLFLL